MPTVTVSLDGTSASTSLTVSSPSSAPPAFVGDPGKLALADPAPNRLILPPWSSAQGVDYGIAVVPDPIGGGRNVLRLTTDDTSPTQKSTMGRSINTHNPAVIMTLGSGGYLKTGADVFIRLQFMVPATFPALLPAQVAVAQSSWLILAEFHGNYAGSPITTFQAYLDPVAGHEVIALRRMGATVDAAGHTVAKPFNDQPWSTPLKRGQWVDLVVHMLFDPAAGFYETYLNVGAWAAPTWQPQRFTDGSTRFQGGRTLNIDPVTGNVQALTAFTACEYMCEGTYGKAGRVNVFHAKQAIGSSLASVS